MDEETELERGVISLLIGAATQTCNSPSMIVKTTAKALELRNVFITDGLDLEK